MFPEEVQSTFLHALGNFSNIQFVWKMRTKPDQLPENIYVQKWLPQQDILGKFSVFNLYAFVELETEKYLNGEENIITSLIKLEFM